PVEWHQDWAFYPHTNDDLLAVGVMLDDCRLENGPLLVVPGSHRGPVWDHHAGGSFCGAVDPAAIAREIERAVPLTGRAGSMSVHHGRLLHGSAQNVSDLPRALLLYEYAAADPWPLMGVRDLADFDARFVFGLPSIVAVIINYVKRADARGTWVGSHFRWQIRTFWFTALWCLVGLLLFVTLVGIPFALAVFFGAGLWAIYRIVRGWLNLRDHKPMY